MMLVQKELNNTICSNIDGPRNYHTTWNMPESVRQISCDITYMWKLKKKDDTDELIYKNRNRLTDIENKFLVAKGEREG